MRSRADLLMVIRWSLVTAILCLSFAHSSYGHPCGENPLRRMASLTRVLNEVFPNRDINSLLNILRTTQPELYSQIQDEWRSYASCVGLVDTGYFKRSPHLASVDKPEPAAKLIPGVDRTAEIAHGFSGEIDLLADILRQAILLNKWYLRWFVPEVTKKPVRDQNIHPNGKKVKCSGARRVSRTGG